MYYTMNYEKIIKKNETTKMNFEIEKLNLQDCLLIKSKILSDDRGYFQEIFKNSFFESLGIFFTQCNYSFSQKNVIRGLHYQQHPYEQGKLIVPIIGHIQDVIVDLRKNSKTYLQHLSIELKNNNIFLYVPEGFAHGFSVLSSEAHVMYFCTNEYDKNSEKGICFNDTDLNINWKVKEPIISEKDKQLPFLSEVVENEK